MSFHEVQFPTDISYGSAGGPGFSTDIITVASGHEQRNINWQSSRARYEVQYGVRTEAQLQSLISFFHARQGKAYGFRFKDWTDYQATQETVGVGDGVETDFQLTKTYTSGATQISRVIYKPVANSLSVFIDDVEQVSGWSIDTTTGVLSFLTAPSASALIKCDFNFDVPVRFDTDTLLASLDSYGVGSANTISLIEIRV